MYIKEFALKYHLTNDTIRFYEKEGLLHPVRLENGYRFYNEQCERTIKFILVLKHLGFSLQEISALLKLDEQSFTNDCNVATATLFSNKIGVIEKQIELYSAALQALKMVERLIAEGKYEENKNKTEEMVEEMFKKISGEEGNHALTKLD